MQKLINAARQVLEETEHSPFSVYSCVGEHRLINVPIIKPTLVCVLKGSKTIGHDFEASCAEGHFLFLSNRPSLAMRNIPGGREYIALVIEFDYEDFDGFVPTGATADTFFNGRIDSILEQTLQQFVHWSSFAPKALWPVRRREILQLLYHLGHTELSNVIEPPSLGHKIYNIIGGQPGDELSAEALSSRLGMSESTLRRRLNAEGLSLQSIKDKARLSLGLHLVQASRTPIGLIAEKCGYQSQSRFTEKFKQLFGVTPTELRKTRLSD